jgi:hypothetical protein
VLLLVTWGIFMFCILKSLVTFGLWNMRLLHSEIPGYIWAMEYAATHGCMNVWLESNLTSALLMTLKKASLVPISLRDRWHNCFHLYTVKAIVVQISLLIWANQFKDLFGLMSCRWMFGLISVWIDLDCPLFVSYRLYSFYLLLFEGFDLVPPFVYIFPSF